MPDRWSDDELGAAADAYRNMQRREDHDERYSKKSVYRSLAQQFGRSDKAFEYRMQNVSAVLDEDGEPWVPGLPPAKISPCDTTDTSDLSRATC